MNRFFTIFSFCLLSAGAPAVFAAMGPGPAGGGNAQTTIHGQEQQPTGQQSPQQRQQQQQKGPDAVTPFNQGIAFMKVKNYAAAVPKFEAALKANPNLPQAHLLAAYCLRQLGPSSYASSLQHLNAALKLNSKYAEAYE